MTDEAMTLEVVRAMADGALELALHAALGLCAHKLVADPPVLPGKPPKGFKCERCGRGGFDLRTDFVGRVVGVHRYAREIGECRKAEELFLGNQPALLAYEEWLDQTVGASRPSGFSLYDYLNATPRQKAEAMLLALTTGMPK
jgi:hypothetical protein